MSHRDPGVPFRHMLDHASEAVEMVRGKSRADLNTDRKLNLSLVRLLEVVGEAAGRVPKQEQESHPEIPWTDIISLRNRLIHGYDQVDFDILWAIVAEDLPPLIVTLDTILSDNKP